MDFESYCNLLHVFPVEITDKNCFSLLLHFFFPLFYSCSGYLDLPSDSWPVLLQILYEMGELLASASGLCFLRDRVMWQPTTNTSKDSEEPWRALYG